MIDLREVLIDLDQSGIGFTLRNTSSHGWYVQVEMTGGVGESVATCLPSLDEARVVLIELALENHPESLFARKYGIGGEQK